MSTGKIPFLDLTRQHLPIQQELTAVFEKAVATSGFIGGEPVTGFETEFAHYTGTQHCAGVNSGTDALRFALSALGVKSGDAVVTTPHTFIATTEAISQVGASIQFVDVEPGTGLMSVQALKVHLERVFAKPGSIRPKAIIPVHLYGQCVDMDGVMELARQYGLRVLEDACQAHGALYKGKKAGSIGDMAAFSFYPGKNLGALGEGGAVTSNDKALIDHVKILRDHGQREKYHHAYEGYNGRLDAIQAGCLRVKLRHLDAWNDMRRRSADHYTRRLSELKGIRVNETGSHNHHVFHLYVAYVADPKAMFQYMTEQGIGCGFHYPIPLHLQPCYQHLGFKQGDFPISERLSRELISLPMFPGLREDEVDRVCEQIAAFLKR